MSTLKADTLQAKTTNGTLTLANNGTGKVELPADATIGGVALGSDQTARDMATSAMALILANTDANQQGAVGPFWLADDFESDNLTTKTNATYNAAGDYYSSEGSIAEDGTIGVTPASDGVFGDGLAGRKNIGLQFVASQTGTLTTASAYPSNTSAALQSSDFHFELWTDSGGSPGSQVGTDSETRTLTNSNQVEAFTFASPPALTSGATYWLVLVDENTNGYVYNSIVGSQAGFGSGNNDTITSMTDTGPTNNASEDWVIGVENTAGPTNVTLAPTAVTITTANPTDILGYVVIDPQEAITVGTDIVMTASIDGGTTDATGSWTKVGDIGTTELYRVEFDVSAQTGSSLIYEITTANAKEIRYNASVGLVPLY